MNNAPKKTNILIVGATSLIAQNTARELAKKGYSFILIARNTSRLEVVKNDLQSQGASSVKIYECDSNDEKTVDHIYEILEKEKTIISKALFCHGTLQDQELCFKVPLKALNEIKTNYLSYVYMVLKFLPLVPKNANAVIGIISSVAGDRGRQSNFIYGSAKAGLTTFSEGLRNKLYNDGIHVMTIKPGIVDSPMTSSLVIPKLLTSSAKKVGGEIALAMEQRVRVLYTPSYWRWIMMAIKHIPSFIFDRLKL